MPAVGHMHNFGEVDVWSSASELVWAGGNICRYNYTKTWRVSLPSQSACITIFIYVIFFFIYLLALAVNNSELLATVPSSSSWKIMSWFDLEIILGNRLVLVVRFASGEQIFGLWPGGKISQHSKLFSKVSLFVFSMCYFLVAYQIDIVCRHLECYSVVEDSA